MPDENIIQAALAAIASRFPVIKHGDGSFMVVPERYALQDLKAFEARPRRIIANPAFVSLESFIAYVLEFKTGATKLFADSVTGSITASIDGDALDAASWKTHSARYIPKETEEWRRWRLKDNQYQSQADFAEFIEYNVLDITDPSGAAMLEIAKTFEAKTSTEFKSGVRLDNGNQKLTFAQETTARAGVSNELEIPTEFKLALTPFAFGEAFRVVARLRYRVDENKALRLKYQLINPHKVIESVVLRIIDRVAEETEIRPLIGAQ